MLSAACSPKTEAAPHAQAPSTAHAAAREEGAGPAHAAHCRPRSHSLANADTSAHRPARAFAAPAGSDADCDAGATPAAPHAAAPAAFALAALPAASGAPAASAVAAAFAAATDGLCDPPTSCPRTVQPLPVVVTRRQTLAVSIPSDNVCHSHAR